MMISGRAAVTWSATTLLLASLVMGHAFGTATYTPDSAIYAKMMLADRNVPLKESTNIVRRFFTREFRADAFLLKLVGPSPPRFFEDQYSLFRSRPVYPYVASLAFNKFGFRALSLISSVAYILLTFTLFWLLRSFGPSWLAAVATFCAVLLPLSYPTIYDLGTYALTDSLALLLSLVALLAQVRYTISGEGRWLVPYVLASILFAATRPAIYLILGAALAVLLLGVTSKSRRFTLRGLVMSLIAVAVSICYEVYITLIHAPGLAGQMKYYYEVHLALGHHKDVSFGVWYLLQLARAVTYELHDVIFRPLGLAVTVVGLYGLFLGRRKPEIACVIGAMLSLLVAVLMHPVPGDQGRTIEVPMIPILAIGVVNAIRTRLLTATV